MGTQVASRYLARGKRQRLLGALAFFFALGACRWAAAGPLSERILFVAAPGGVAKIYEIRPDGKELRRFTQTPGSEREPNVSVAARCVTFRCNRDGNYEIYRANLDGKEQVRLTFHPANDRHPSFSPDGQRVVFATTRWGEEELAIVNTTNGEKDGIFQLTRDAAVSFNPAWSPTGEWIAYSSYFQGQADLYLISPDGQKKRRLTRDRQPDVTPTWSPDGKKVAFQTQRGPRDLPCLAIYHLDEDRLEVLEEIPEQAQYPSWSADGRALMYVGYGTRLQPTQRQLQLLDLDTREVRAFEIPTAPGSPPFTALESEWTPFPLPW